MGSNMLLIKGGQVVSLTGETDVAEALLIKDDKIMKMGKLQEIQAFLKESGMEGGEVTTLDASGLVVAPGLIDVHVHFRDPGFTEKEDMESGARAAAKGGFTTVVLMANTKPAADNEDTISYIINKGRETGIHMKTCANVTVGMKGKELTNMEALAAAGAAGFTDDGAPILEEALARQAMCEAARLSMPISFHEEDPSYIEDNGINKGKASAHFSIGGSDRMAEIVMVERDLRLAEGTGADIVIQHISAKEAVWLVREAKKKNPHVHAEATPHHFTLTEDAAIQYGTYAKMNPPLREEADRLAIIEGLKDGTIDLIATDHAPHTREEKEKELTKAPSGIIGLETALSLGIKELVEKGYLSMTQLLERMSLGPAKLYGLDGGYLAEGGPADVVLFHPSETYIAGAYASKASNTPFTGKQLPGVVYATICGGRIVYRKGV